MGEPTVLLVRFRPGVVGLTRRVVHVVPMPDGGAVPEQLTANCGLVIDRAQVELLDGPVGSPCELCLLRTPIPGPGALPSS